LDAPGFDLPTYFAFFRRLSAVEHLNRFVIVSRQYLLAIFLACAAVGGVGAEAVTTPAPETPQPAAETPAPAPEPPKPAAETPAPAPEPPKPAAETPAPAPEPPKPAAETPAPAPEPPKPTAETPAPAPEPPKPAAETPAPAPEPPKPAAETPAPAPEPPKPAAETPAPAPEPPKPAAETPAPAPEPPKPAAETPPPAATPRKRAAEASERGAAASGDAPEKRLRFMFRYQRWSDVLEWFADQADLSLVLDAPPPGTFNYSDSRDYSVSEAIDLLNSVLLTKGFTLIRRERMLTLIDLSGEFPEGLIPRVTPEEVKERGKHELVTVEFSLGRRDPAAVTAAVTPLLGPYHKLLPVVPTKQVFVTDRAGVMTNVQKVIESIAEPKDPPPAPVPPKAEPRELKVYPIDKADPDALMSILEKLVTGAQLVFDPNLNQLHVNATASQHATLQTVLDQIISAAATDRERRVEVYRLDVLTAEAATQLVETLKAIAPKAALSLKADESMLIAWASPAEHDAIRAAVDKLGGGPAGDSVKSPQLEIYRLTRVDPAKLIEMLEKLVPDAKLSYDERSRSLIALAKAGDQQAIRATLDQLQAEAAPDGDDQPRFETYEVRARTAVAGDALISQIQPLVPEAKISLDERSGRLVVYGTAREQQLVKSALEKLGLEKPADDPRVMEVYALGAADPTTTVALLQQLVPTAEFTPDATQQRLAAVAAPADHERIKATLEKLRTAPADAQAAQLRFYPFDQEPAAEVLESLAKVAPQAKITVDAENQRLLVVASATDQTAVETAFQQFQQATPAKGKPELAIYPLESSDTAGLLEVLKTLYPKLQIVPDAPAKRLLVWASPEEQASVQASLDKLKAKPTADQQPQFETYEIRVSGTLTTTDPLLTQLQSVVPDAKITVDAQNRRLIVYATPLQQQLVKSALEKLGLDKPTDDARVMEVYALGTVDATATLTLLQQLVPDAEFTADAAQQRLVAVAAPADHERIKATLEKLRATPADTQAAQLRFYPFDQEPPTEVLELLAKVAPQAKLTVDAENQRLMVVASAADQTAVETAFQQFQQAVPAQGKRELATYPIRSSDPASLVEMLKTLYPKVQIVHDVPAKRLLVWATSDEQSSLRASIEKLEAEPAADQQPRFESYPLHGFATAVEAGSLVTSLQPLVPNARFTLDSKVKNLIVWATEEEHAIVRRALERLGQGPAPQNTPQLEVHRLSKTDADTTLALLQKLVPEAQLTLDAKTGNLVALAVPADQLLIRATLLQLQPGGGDAGMIVRFHALLQTPSESLLNILKEMVPAAQLTPDAENKRLIAVASAADHEAIQKIVEQFEADTPLEQPRRLAVYPVTAAQRRRFEAVLPSLQTEMPGLQLLSDDNPGSLTVWAKPSEHLIIAETVKQLAQDASPTEQLQLATYTCAAADPATISEFVTTLFPDAKFVVDAKTRRIMVWARPQDHERIKPALEQLATGKTADFEEQFQAYSLSKVPPDIAVPMLQQQLPDAKIVADAKSGKVLAWASKTDHEVIAKAIEQLQAAPDDKDKPRLVVYPRGDADPQTIVQMLTSLVPTARLAVDAQTGGLAAWAAPEDHETIREAIEEMSKEEVTAAKPATKVYALKHITAEAALRVLASAVPTAKLSTGADESQLVAVAQPREQQMLQAIIEEIDVEGTAAGKSSVAIYRLEHKTSSTAVLYALSVFRSAFPKANFTLGADLGEFVAWATPKDHEGIKILVDQLNAGPTPENAPQVALHTLNSITAASAITVLQTAVPRATFSTDPADAQRLTALARPSDQEQIKAILTVIDVEGEPGSQPSVVVYQLERQTSTTAMSYAISLLTQAFPRARLLLGTELGQFVAWAAAKDHEGIKALVAQLNAGPPAEEAPEATVYSLQHITATAAMSLLTTAVPKAKISSDAENPRRLTAYASPADHAAIKTILEKIDVQGDPAGDAVVAIYRLEGSTAATSLYYTLTVFRTAFPKATLSVGAETGQFVAWATPKDQEGIKALVEQLNAAPAPEDAPQVALYTTKWITATSAADVLRVAVPKATFTVDTANAQRLTANARTADHESIKTILATIDVESDPGSEPSVVVYQLERQISLTATTYAASLLTQAFPRARFLPGTEAGQFVAWAAAKDHEGIKALVAQLNAGPPAEEVPEATVYSLQHITATAAMSLLTTAVPKAKISSDAENPRRLTAYASPADHAAIKTILEKIDVQGDPAGDAVVAIYRLEGSTAATSLYYTLTVFRTAFPKATLSVGAETGQFVAWATPKDQEGIKALVEQLNAAPAPEDAPQVALYTTKWITATSAADVLRVAVPKATFTVDTANAQRLTANARTADHESIKTILATIDVESDPGSEPSVVVYQLERQISLTATTYAASLLTQAFPRARFLPGTEAGQFVAWAAAKDHEGIKALVAQLNAGPPPEEAPEATVYTLQHITATAATSLLTTAVPKAKISSDAETPRRLTAYASPADHAAIKTILEKIDVQGDPAGDAVVAIYRLEGPTTVTSLYYSLAVFRSAFPKAIFSTGAETGQFVAWATPKDQEGIKALVEQLNAAPAPEETPKVVLYTLEWITAATATSVLQVAVPKATFTADPNDPQRLAAHARAADHGTIETVLAEIDVEGGGGGRSSAVVYLLERQTSPTAMTYAINLLTQAFPRARFLTGTEIGQFVAWATPKDQEEIKALVDRLNAGPPPEEAPEATVYSLQHITATTALTLLTTAVPKAKFAPDAAEPRRLTAYASPADQVTIKQILDKIDVEGDAPVGTTVAIYQLEGQATTIQLYYTLTIYRTAFPKATFSTGVDPGQFVAWATAREHEGIKALVEQMNAGPPPEQKLQVELYTLKTITATSAAEVLRAALPRATFTVDPANAQRLTANARPADHEMVKTILTKIDVEGDPGTEPSVAVYQLERQTSPTAMTYAISLLTQAFPRARFLTGTEIGQFVAWAAAKDQEGIQALVDRLNAGPPPEEAPEATVYPLQHITATTALTLLSTAVPRAKLAPDAADPRRLTAYASPADQATIKQILDKIDVEGDPTGGATVAVYQLEGQTTATSVLYTLVAFRTAFPRATFSAGADPGQFVAWATPKEHEGIKSLVEQINAGLPPEQKPQVVLYTLNEITATSAADVLRATVPRATLTVDPVNAQRLTASARLADHETIKTILAEIDVEGEPGTEPSVAVYQLERQTSPTAMTYAITLLTQAFPRARFLTGTEIGQFVAWAAAKDQEGIQALVDRLNAGPPPEEAPEATVYPLQHITATTALTLLTTIVPRAKLAPDAADPRRLTAYASPADQATIKQILDKIDVEGDPTGGATVAVYQLEGPATVTTISYTLVAFRTAFPRATFSVGADPGQIIAWATAKDHEGIKALVDQLNAGPPPEQKPQVALYTLQFITATVAADVLRTAVPKATFTTDPDDPQRLTANARLADHETIKQVLAEIDVEGEGGGRSTVEIYKLLGPQAETAITYAFRLLMSAFPRARFSLGTEPAQFVAWASPRDHIEIRALVDRLNAAPPPDEAPQASVYSLKNITATTAQSVLTSALPRVKLTADPADPQRLTAYATPIDQATIKKILDQIDVEGDPDASYSVQIYTLEGMSTRALYYAGVFLARVLPNARFTPGAEEAQLVVWATAKDHEQILGLIEQLQKEPPPELARKIAVYSLQHLTGDAALTLLRSAVPKAELTTNPADTQRINAWASPADHTRIQAILQEVDVKPDPESAATAVVYQLEGMSQTAAFYALRFLRDAVPQANFALGGEGGQLVAWARTADHEVIAQLVKQLVEESPDAARTAQVYNLQHATAATAISALSPVVPRASLTIGADPSQLAVFARPLDHAKIAEILKELDKPAPPETEPTAVVYTLQSGNAAEAMRIVRTAVPQANLSAGAEPHQMIAWARPADHKIIQQIVERMGEKGPDELARKVAVYSIESGDATIAMTLLRTAVPGAQFSVGSDPRRLIAWATPADHEAIKRAVDEIAAGAAQMTSQVYRLRYGDPQTAMTVLQALVPLAKMAIDTNEGTLVASALPEDHLKIKATIEQMDSEDADGQRPALKIHRVTIGSVANVYRSLAILFRSDTTVQLSLDADNDAVIAIASGAKQERIAELVKSLEDAARQDAQSTIQLYSLRNVDSRSALRLLEQMLDKQAGKADLSVDQLSNQLVAVAPPEVHEQIAKTLDQLRGDESELEIYDLQYVDPISAETAIFRQFADDGLRAPEVSIDPITQQLFIRATTEQQQKIRELLIKMGETRLALLRGRSSQNMRTVPFQGDPKAAVEQIRRIWSTLRDNEIRIVGPDQPLPAPAGQPSPPAETKPQPEPEPAAQPKPAEEKKPAEKPADQPMLPAETKPQPEEDPKDEEKPKAESGQNAAFRTLPAWSAWLTATTSVQPSASPAEDAPSAPPSAVVAAVPDEKPVAVPAAPPPAEPPPSAPAVPDPPPERELPPPAPIYIVPSDGSITIVCDDPEALEQFEKLLRAMSGTSGEIGRNISIYELKHSNAIEMAEKLRELYDMRRRSWRLGGSEVVIVPDERLNRILVQGSRIDRETIDGLIRALDTEEGTASRPQIVPVRYAEARDVADVVREVFRSQLTRSTAGTTTSGTRTSSVSRITPQVAVDEASNSLIVMAPSPLLDEILKLVNSLDESAEHNPARRLRIISLQKTNAARVDEALQRILKTRSPRPTR
jgi:type II secretory pathway component GspD/PulD (secretin)